MFAANGVSLDDLNTEERDQVMDGLNAMSRFPKKRPAVKPTIEASPLSGRSAANLNQNKAEPPPTRTLRNQKEVVIDIPTLLGKGYPPMNLDGEPVRR